MEKITLIEARNLSTRANTLHAFLGRTGGISPPPFSSLNVGFHVGDRRANVEENLRTIEERLGFNMERAVIPRQVHGDHIVHIKNTGMCGAGIYSADALVTDLRGVALCILTADCVPIILVDRGGRVAAIIHAGWRGTLKSIATKTIKKLKALYGIEPEELVCAVGPAIGGCCYRVDATLIEGFSTAFRGSPGVDRRASSLDLKSINCWQIEKEGVKDIEVIDTCTACNVDRFFSYRREGTTGRQLNVVMLRG